VIFWRSPCPHVASCTGVFEEDDTDVSDVYEENDVYGFYEDDEEADEFSELIEYYDNQRW
jgi:hypothetical protein